MNIISQNWQKRVVCGCVLISGLTTVNSANVLAQITPDNSLGGQSSIVNPNGIVQEKPAIIIEGGARLENNLFHSLREFNISDGQQVYFANPAGVQNILTRVTEAQSLIDGTLGVNGTANLFLINPRGIIFGGNAKLDIQGSFLASTADSIVFENGLEYSAVNPETPLLTMRVPVGLQFGQNVAEINVVGTGHNIFANETGDFFIDERNQGLTVQPQQNLAIIGGNVNLNGGNLTAPGGQIHLGSVSREGFVGLNLTPQNWQFDYSNIQGFGNINLTNAASADVTGGSGKIDVRAGNLLLSDGSGLFALTETEQPAGNIEVNVSDTMEIVGVSGNDISSGLFTETTSSGSAGDISVQTGNLRLETGGQISSSSFGEGRGGNIEIKAGDSIEVIEGLEVLTGIFANSFSTGVSGNIRIETNQLTVSEKAEIATTAFGTDINEQSLTTTSAGNLTIKASDIQLSQGAGLFTVTQGLNNGGNLIIDTERLIATEGSQLNVSSFVGSGNAGNLFVNAKESITLQGKPLTADGGSGSGFYANVEVDSTGQRGNITVNTPQLIILDGARIFANTSSGDGGNINIDAGLLVGINNGDISANAGDGNGGIINITIREGIFGIRRQTREQLETLLGTTDLSEFNPKDLPSSEITAIALQPPNLEGQINFKSPELDPTTGAIKTPQNPSPLPQIARGCEAQPGQNTSSFINTGTGGLPPNPSTPYLGVSTWQDFKIQPQQNTRLIPTQTNSNQIIEAQGFEWANANKTRIKLTANSRNVTPSSSWQIPGNCYGK